MALDKQRSRRDRIIIAPDKRSVIRGKRNNITKGRSAEIDKWDIVVSTHDCKLIKVQFPGIFKLTK